MKSKYLFYSIFGAVLVNFLFKGIFLMVRYGFSGRAAACEHGRGEGKNGSIAEQSGSVSHEFILTTMVYGLLSVLRFLEYLVLAIQFYKFLFVQGAVRMPHLIKKHSRRYFYLLLFSIILLPYFLLGIVIPSLGIYQELEHSMRIEECYSHYPEVYITYCVINFFRYMSAYAVRMVFIFTTLAISKLWFPEHDGVPAHTSSGHIQASIILVELPVDDSSRENGSENVSSINQYILVQTAEEAKDILHLQDGNKSNSPSARSDSNIQDVNASNSEEMKAVHDWNLVSEDFQQRAIEYQSIGEQVKLLQDLFQTWFIIPWIVYLVASSLKTYNILRPWNLDDDGDTPPSDIPQVYYLLYNVNQFITLLIPFLCAKKINTYHQKYYKMMRESQMKKFWNMPSQLSWARQLCIEKNETFDFVPRIWGTQISINVSSPLFIFLLLAGLFLSVTKSLLQN